jgi:hypothetical protein
MAAMGVSVRVLGWIGTERRAADRRLWATQALSNLAERVSAEPFGRVAPARAKELASEAHADRVLPEAEWSIDVADEPRPVPARRVALLLRWKERSGGWDGPARLTFWVYRAGGAHD